MVATEKTKGSKRPEPRGAHDPTDAIQIELRKAREAKGLSFSDLHRLTGLSRTALHQYETGKTKPGAREILRLCEVLEVSPNRLLTGSETTPIGSSGVLLPIAHLAQANPIRALAISPLLLPLVAGILSKIGNDTLVAIAMIADETLRARDPETFAHLAKMVAEFGKLDEQEVAAMSPEERKRASLDFAAKVGPHPGAPLEAQEANETEMEQISERLEATFQRIQAEHAKK